jgi:hypothetical protein
MCPAGSPDPVRVKQSAIKTAGIPQETRRPFLKMLAESDIPFAQPIANALKEALG